MRQESNHESEHLRDSETFESESKREADSVDVEHADQEPHTQNFLTKSSNQIVPLDNQDQEPESTESERPLAVRSTVSSAIWFHASMLILSLIVVGLSVSMRVPGEEQVYLPGIKYPVPGMCASRMFLGVNCPGCGLTRSFICLGHGQIERAWHFNPGGIVFYLFVVAQIPWRITQLILIGIGVGERWVGKFDWVLWIVASALVLQWLLRGAFTQLIHAG